MRDSVWLHFQIKCRGENGEYDTQQSFFFFWWTLRCLELWSKFLECYWYIFYLSKLKLWWGENGEIKSKKSMLRDDTCSFLTLSPLRVSLWRVKSSGVRQSKIFKWPLVVKGLRSDIQTSWHCHDFRSCLILMSFQWIWEVVDECLPF